MLKESDGLDILGVTFDYNITFEKHLRTDSRAASLRFIILRKSYRLFQDRFLLGRCFQGFVLSVLEYCSEVWCSAADAHFKLLVMLSVASARLLSGGVLECNISLRRSVEVYFIIYAV